MDDIILHFFKWSNKPIENFIGLFILFLLGAYVLMSILRSLLSRKWLQLYKNVYSRYIVFENLAETPNLSKNTVYSHILLFFIALIPLSLVALLVEFQGPLAYMQFFTGILLGEFYILLDFLAGILLFLFIRRHPEDISGTAYFKKNIVTRLRLISLSQKFSLVLILTIFMPTYYMCGLLVYFSIFYSSVLVCNYTSRIE